MKTGAGTTPGKDLLEFYALAEELFTPEEAAVTAAMASPMATARS